MEEQTVKMSRKGSRAEERTRLALTIVTHPNLERVGETAIIDELEHVTRTRPVFALPGRAEPAPIAANHVSRRPVLAIRPRRNGATLTYEHDDAYVTVDGLRIGGPMHFGEAELSRGVFIAIEGRVGLLLHSRPGPPVDVEAFGMVGVSPQMEETRQRIRSLAPLDMSVLLRGETGTGKELAAQALHMVSDRRSRRFFAVNLAALDASIAASELFGHVKGAFTGASDARRGYFREADGGTLFLDEVGEAAPELQTALLRALETGQVIPVGSDRPVSVDVRVIAATDADLESEIATRSFRAPLFHRLAEVEIHLPTLRERPVDIPLLFARFVREHAETVGLDLARLPGGSSTDTTARLLAYDWPGNVRELRNAAASAVVHSMERDALELGPNFGRARLALDNVRPRDPSASVPVPSAQRTDLSTIGEQELIDALVAADWRPEPAADALGIAKTSIYQLIRNTPSIPESGKLTAGEIEAALEACDGDETEAARRLRVPRRGLLHRMKRLGLR